MSLLKADVTRDENLGFTDRDAINALYQQLDKGIQSMKNGKVYTIEEAWKVIDKI